MKKLAGVMLLLIIAWHSRAQIPCLPGSLSAGVMAYYPFGAGSLDDASGNGHILMNPTTAHPVPDRFGSPDCAYYFNRAAGDYLIVDPGTGGGSSFIDNMTTHPFSISLWYKPQGPRGAGSYELLIGRGTTASTITCPDTWGEWSLGLYDCRKAVAGFDMYSLWQTPALPCPTFQTASTGWWHHAVLTFDGAITRQLYIDGTLYTTTVGSCGAMAANVGDLMLGRYFTGRLDDIILYDRVLTPGEVVSLFSAVSCCSAGPGDPGSGPCSILPGSASGGVMALYPFSSGSLADMSGNGHSLINTTSAHPTADRFGNPTCAYHFNMANGDYLQIPTGSSGFLDDMTLPTHKFTVSLWYQPTDPRADIAYELLMGRGTSLSAVHCPADTWGEWSIGLSDCREAVVGFDQYSTWQTLGTMSCPAFNAAVTGNWHHLAFVWDGVTRSLYVDGVFYGGLVGPCGPMTTNVGDLMLGVGFNGDLDDIAIYDHSLSAPEVADLYAHMDACCINDVIGDPPPPPPSGNPGDVFCLGSTLNIGVVAYYPCTSDWPYLDGSGMGHDLVSDGAVAVKNRFGTENCALHFEKASGSNLHMATGTSGFLDNLTAGPFSISLWYRPADPSRAPGDYELLVGRGPTSGLHCPDTWGEWSVGLANCQDATVGFDQYSTSEASTSCATHMSSLLGTWHHLVFVYDGISSRQLYIDGVLYSTLSGPCGFMTSNLGDLIIGQDFTGDLDDIIIYNRDLSPTEVNELWTTPDGCCIPLLPPPPPPCRLPGTLNSGLLALYTFGGGSLTNMANPYYLTGTLSLINPIPSLAYPTMDRCGNSDCAYHFNASTNDRLQVAPGGSHLLDNLTTHSFSISLWYNPTWIGWSFEVLAARGDATAAVHCPDTWGEWSIGLYDCKQPVAGFDMYSTWAHTLPVLGCSYTGWHHLVLVYDAAAGTRSIYIDNVLLSTISGGACGAMAGNIGELVFGDGFTGDLDDIFIYNRAVSVPEVATLYTLGCLCCHDILSKPGKKAPDHTNGDHKVKMADQNKGIKVFPNPSDGEVYVYSGGEDKIRSVSVYNSTGQLVGTYSFDATEVSVDLSKLASGMYMFKVTTDSETTMQRVIKE